MYTVRLKVDSVSSHDFGDSEVMIAHFMYYILAVGDMYHSSLVPRPLPTRGEGPGDKASTTLSVEPTLARKRALFDAFLGQLARSITQS